MNTVAKLWEKRSKIYGKQIEGVLPKSFPPVVNEYLDDFMFNEVSSVVKNQKLKILDLGCGYGRLSKRLLNMFPKTKLFGIDISGTYVELYNKELSPGGKAKTDDIRNIPFESKTFDTVFMVTALMYLQKKEDQKKCINEIFRVLKKRGKFVIIERNESGYKWLNLWGLVSNVRGKIKREIPSVSFTKKYLEGLINQGGGKLISAHGIPVCSMFLHPLIILSMFNPSVGRFFLKIAFMFDLRFNYLLTPSLYISYIGVNENS